MNLHEAGLKQEPTPRLVLALVELDQIGVVEPMGHHLHSASHAVATAIGIVSWSSR